MARRKKTSRSSKQLQTFSDPPDWVVRAFEKAAPLIEQHPWSMRTFRFRSGRVDALRVSALKDWPIWGKGTADPTKTGSTSLRSSDGYLFRCWGKLRKPVEGVELLVFVPMPGQGMGSDDLVYLVKWTGRDTAPSAIETDPAKWKVRGSSAPVLANDSFLLNGLSAGSRRAPVAPPPLFSDDFPQLLKLGGLALFGILAYSWHKNASK